MLESETGTEATGEDAGFILSKGTSIRGWRFPSTSTITTYLPRGSPIFRRRTSQSRTLYAISIARRDQQLPVGKGEGRAFECGVRQALEPTLNPAVVPVCALPIAWCDMMTR